MDATRISASSGHRWHAAGILLFLVCLPALFVLLGRPKEAKETPGSFQAMKRKLVERFPGWAWRFDIEAPMTAKNTRLFWIYRSEQEGVGVDLVNTPELARALFPGFPPAMVRNKALWDLYFSREFNPSSYLEHLEEFSREGYMISYSWTGCLDFIRQYGADVVIIGNSETYRSLVVDQFQRRLSKTSPWRDPSVLYCVASTLPLESITEFAALMAEAGPKPKLVVMGFSYWTTARKSKYLEQVYGQKKRDLELYRLRGAEKEHTPFAKLKEILHYRLSDYFPPLKWVNLMPNSYWLDIAGVERPAGSDQPEPPVTDGLYLDKEIAADEARLAEALKKGFKPAFSAIADFQPGDCAEPSSYQSIAPAVKALKEVSENLFVYVTPTSTQHRQVAPCLWQKSMAELEALAVKEKFGLSLESPTDYGLTLADSIVLLPNPKRVYFDGNHVNYSGAKKVTDRLADKIGEYLRKTDAVF